MCKSVLKLILTMAKTVPIVLEPVFIVTRNCVYVFRTCAYSDTKLCDNCATD